jgi:integrase
MPLTDVSIRSLGKAGKYFDGGGLYIEVTAQGRCYWRLKYRFAGREKRLALGVYPEVGLKAARAKRDEARALLRDGKDPGAIRAAEKTRAKHDAANTFEALARDWLQHMGSKWAAVTRERVLAAFERDVFPAIGRRPIVEIKPREVAAIAKAVEARGAGEMASRVLQRVRAVFRYAVAHERLESNPLSELAPSEVLKPRQVKHRAALADPDLPAFLRKLDRYEGDPTTKHALHLLMLTAVRPGELRGARWDEIDTERAVWRIPAARMKMKVDHVVPLSKQAIAAIEAMRPLSGGGVLVFPSPFYPGKSLSENTLNSALARMGYKGIATAHGFRALFSTVANECGWDADVIERQLAHRERNAVRAAYHRAAYLEERARLMQWWADYLDGRRTGARVVPMHRAARTPDLIRGQPAAA